MRRVASNEAIKSVVHQRTLPDHPYLIRRVQQGTCLLNIRKWFSKAVSLMSDFYVQYNFDKVLSFLHIIEVDEIFFHILKIDE